MAKGSKPYFLLAVVFAAGLAIMAVEMSASRLLAPYFGTSLFVWTNLIGMTMIALTVGYWWGGKLADRYPNERTLYSLLFGAGCYILLIPFMANPIMQFAIAAIDQRNLSVFLWSLFATIVQFFLPLMVLAMTAPFAIRICAREIRAMGTTAGSLYAIGNIGSILGTFIPALLAIPLIGTKRTIIVCGLLLVILGAVGLRKHVLHLASFIGILLLFIGGPIKATAGMIYEGESPYNYIQVVEQHARRELRLNEGHAIHSIYDPRSVLVGGVWDYFLLFPLLKPENDAALIIGLAGGTVSRAYAAFYPSIRIDGVEIDPQILDVGARYFGLAAQQSLNPITADGRTFLKQTANAYDFIFIDAYKQPYIPFHLTTREFFAEVQAHLREGGIAAINVGASSPDAEILWLIANTMAAVFRHVQIIAVPQSLNFIVMASDVPYDVGALAGQRHANAPLAALAQGLKGNIAQVQFNPALQVFTDDRAPVELYTEKMIVGYARREPHAT